ncbi:phospho-sugar mutase [Treponema sp. R6D11]
MDYLKKYEDWKINAPELKNELADMSDDEVKFAFGADLVFGTGGLRGIMQAGTNAINKYTIKKATMGLAECICTYGDEAKARGVAISYDTRLNSDVFAKAAAEVLSSYGIVAYLSDAPRPTPVLSYAVRELGAIAGIMVTASHNPKEYNGYKCYWEDGGQLPPDVSQKVIDIIDVQNEFADLNADKKFIKSFGKELEEKYKKTILAEALDISGDIKICYTPLYGCGIKFVPDVLKRAGFSNVVLVDEQMKPNGEFPLAPYPNPESAAAWAEAIRVAIDADADIIIATDPDADRVGCMAKKDGEYIRFSGNQIGTMLLEFLIANADLPDKPAVISTVVSSRLTEKIANANGLAYFDVYTGFKFIAERILQFEKDESYNFFFGFEESIGYLKGDYCRDKDAVITSILICQMAESLKKQGKTLFDFLGEVEAKYGKAYEETISIVKESFTAKSEIAAIMDKYHRGEQTEFAGLKIKKVRDYFKLIEKDIFAGTRSEIDLEPTDLIYWVFESGASLAIRPSGTEPKIKYYISATSEQELEQIKKGIS